jgi:plastocyanin
VKALLAALALAAPANVDVRASDTPQRWSQSNVNIEVGDSVTWRFEGTSLAHNVASTGTNWSFVTPFDGQPATYTFTAPGTYRFVCQAHAFTMNGLVRVGAPGPEPDPGEDPLPNGSGAPGVDVRPPSFERVRLRRRAGGARIRYRLSERARTIVRVKRGGRLVWRRAARGRRAELLVRGLRPGHYAVALRARDFGGNPSRIVRRMLRVYR